MVDKFEPEQYLWNARQACFNPPLSAIFSPLWVFKYDM